MKTIILNIWLCTNRARSRMDIKAKAEKEDWDNWNDKEREDFIKEKLLEQTEWGYTVE